MYDNDVINNFYVDGNNNTIDSDMSTDTNMNSMNNNMMGQSQMMMGSPITEGVKEKCIHRTFVHDVPHVCPVHTRIINHHVYRHIYRPRYTCSEENTVSNVQCGSCCNYN